MRDQPHFDVVERHNRILRSYVGAGMRGLIQSERPFGPKRSFSYERPTPLTMFAWYKADTITGVAEDDAVTLWEDSSGNGLDQTPINPGVTFDTFAGHPTVRIGSNSYYYGNMTSPTIAPVSSETWHALWVGSLQEPVIASSYKYWFYLTDDAAGSYIAAVVNELDSGAVPDRAAVDIDTGPVWQFVEGDTIPRVDGALRLFELQVTADSLVFMVDEVTYLDVARTATGEVSVSEINLGLDLRERLAELMVWPQLLSDADRTTQRAYLTGKYGL